MLAKVKKNVVFLGTVAGNYQVCLPFFRLFGNKFPNIVCSTSDICIEGFPRSGNTYFVSGFLSWNKGVSVSHHTHLAGNVKSAIKRKLPTIVLIRRPEDVVSSIVIWDGLLNTTIALLAYIHFYQVLWKHRSRILVLNFDDLTQRPDDCVRKINTHFNTHFDYVDFSPDEDNKIRTRLARVDRRHNRQALSSSLPNRDKSQLKEKFKEHVLKHRLYPYAQRIFSKYCNL